LKPFYLHGQVDAFDLFIVSKIVENLSKTVC